MIVFGYHLVDIVCYLFGNHRVEVDLLSLYCISKHEGLDILLDEFADQPTLNIQLATILRKGYHDVLDSYLRHNLSVVVDNWEELDVDLSQLFGVVEVAGQGEKVVETRVDELSL